jgi:ribosomal protein S18 acetylase RimI-like enzyme
VPVDLRPLREDELRAYVEHARAAYERDLVAQAELSPEQAAAKTATDWDRLFPEGRVAPGNELFAVEDESGERVGDLWIAEREDDGGEKVLYVYSIEIAPAHRGRGLGREAMLLVEDEARSRGIRGLSLTVLGGNDVARSLYRSLGYSERAVFMSKDVHLTDAG